MNPLPPPPHDRPPPPPSGRPVSVPDKVEKPSWQLWLAVVLAVLVTFVLFVMLSNWFASGNVDGDFDEGSAAGSWTALSIEA